jgi:hypothetical protein
MIIWGLGEGIEPPLQGIASFIVHPDYKARVFTTVARLEGVARLLGGPLMSSLVIIWWDGRVVSEGLCFLVSAVSSLP